MAGCLLLFRTTGGISESQRSRNVPIEFPSSPACLWIPGIQELIVIALILVLNAVWIWSLIHCCLNKRLTDSNRIVGIVVIALLNVIGTFLYFVFIPRIPSQGN